MKWIKIVSAEHDNCYTNRKTEYGNIVKAVKQKDRNEPEMFDSFLLLFYPYNGLLYKRQD